MLVTFLILLSGITVQASRECSAGKACVPLEDCPEVKNQLEAFRNSPDDVEKVERQEKLKELVCDRKMICCKMANEEHCNRNQRLGFFKQLADHKVSGFVVAKDEQTMLLCSFSYDGKGPDAFLVVGNSKAVNKPNADDAIPVVPGLEAIKRNFEFSDRDIPILGKFDKETLEVRLPEGESVSGLKWISVFCRDYDIDFGHAIFGIPDA